MRDSANHPRLPPYSLPSRVEDKQYHSRRREMLPFVPEDAVNVLDVGCAALGFGEFLKQGRPDISLWGIDPRPGDDAGGHYEDIVVGLYPQDLCVDIKFDCVIFNDVLEHMPDPWAALEETRSLLGENGHVVASIPNVRHRSVIADLLIRGNWTYTEFGILDATHLRFFTRSSILELFTRAGFDVETIVPLDLPTLGKRGLLRKATRCRFDNFQARQYAVVARPARH